MSATSNGVTDVNCPVCDGATLPVGALTSKFSNRDFALLRCVVCSYAFLRDPRTDFAALYDEAYYAGKGADSLVDYDERDGGPATVRGLRVAGPHHDRRPADRVTP